MSATTTARASEILAAVRELSSTVSARAEEIEAARRIPADLHERFRDLGLYRMLVPASHGGDEIGLESSLPIIETIGRADASVAWTETIGLQSPAVFGLLPRPTFDEIYDRHGPDVTIGGAIAPVGKAHVVDGGYRVEPGRWPFASGCHNWDFLFGNCIVCQDGRPVPDPRGDGPLTRVMVFPRHQAQILDTWRTLGLRGTGSNHFTLESELFVPAEYACVSMLEEDAQIDLPGLFRYPIIEFTFHICAGLIGLGQGTIDDFASLATTRTRKKSARSVAELPAVQHRLGSAEAALSATRDALQLRAQQLCSGELGSDYKDLVVKTWAFNARTADLVIDIVQACFRMYGADAIWDGHPLHRRLRDAFTIVQHASMNDQSLTRSGAGLLGQSVGLTFT
jgi:alkylation response protein AidB-like acyl-CoA dehydrogenase